jgi:MFS family permease
VSTTHPPSRNQWLLVAGAGLAIFMAMLDASVVNVALPTITDAFDVRPEATQWVVLAYLLAMVALVLPFGRWLDVVDKRDATVLALGGFALTSALAATAPNLAWLLIARAAQGGFAALMLAVVPVLATTAVSPEARGRAMGIVATIGPLGAVSGPAVGGLLLSTLGWRSIFFVNLPLSAIGIAVMIATLPREGRLRAPGRDWLVEASLLGGAVLAILLGLTFGASDDATWFVLAGVAIPLLIAWTRLRASAQLLSLFSMPQVGLPLAALTALAAASAVIQFLSPFFLERVIGASPATVGLTVLAFPLAMAVFGPLGGAVADRLGARATALAGALVLTTGIGLAAPLAATWQPIDLAWRLGLAGCGMGLFVGPNQAAIMAATPRPLLGSAGGASGLSRGLGFALGPAASTVAWTLADYHVSGMRVGFGLAVVAGAIAAWAVAAAALGERVRARGTDDGSPAAARGATPAGG